MSRVQNIDLHVFVFRYGRRPMYLAQMILVASAAIALVWLPNIYVYLTIRAVGGLGQGLLYATLFIWGSYNITVTTVVPAKSDSDDMVCLQNYQGLIID